MSSIFMLKTFEEKNISYLELKRGMFCHYSPGEFFNPEFAEF